MARSSQFMPLSSRGPDRGRDRIVFQLSILLCAFTVAGAVAPAQQQPAWTTQQDGTTTDVKVAGGFIYTTGNTSPIPGDEFFTQGCFIRKFDLSGNLIWSNVFGTP